MTDTPKELAMTDGVDRLMNDRQVAAILSLHNATVFRLVREGRFPPPIKLGSSTRWRTSDVVAHIASLQPEAAKTDAA